MADMVLENEMRVLCLDPIAGRRSLSLPHWVELEHRTSKPKPRMTHFFQQGHKYSNKAIPPNNVTFFGLSIFKPQGQRVSYDMKKMM